MAIVAMLGFDNLTAQIQSLLPGGTTFVGEIPKLMKSPVNGKDISLVQAVDPTIITNMQYVSRADSDGNPYMHFSLYSVYGSASANNVNQQHLMGPPISETTLDKTGKWYFGASVFVPSYVVNNSTYAVIGDVDDRTKNVAVLGIGTGSTVTPGYSTGYYLEYEIDWANKTVKAYVDGIQVAATTFTTTPIAYVGSTAATAYLPSNISIPWIPYNYLTNSNYYPALSNIYFAIDKLNDPAPTGRLGPVRVKNVLVATVDSVGDMVPVGIDTNVNAANTAIPLATVPSTSVQLDSGKGKAKFHFAKPVLADNEETISAFQMEVVTFKQRDAAANAVFSFSDGTTASPDYTVISTEAPRRDYVTLQKTYAGGAWTPDAIAAALVSVNSVPNS